MRPLQILMLCCCFGVASAQQATFKELLQKGKDEFGKETPDYHAAVGYLEKAVKLNPKNTEAHYYLGYAYEREPSPDGRGMYDLEASNVIKASNEFETVNKLEPKYKGQLIILDPYTKLTAIWGSLAFSYVYQQQYDSARWALLEGRNRGGFSDFSLAVANEMLRTTNKNSLLFAYGDMPTFSLLYEQLIEGIRTDVLVINTSLLQTIWYPAMLHYSGAITLSMSEREVEDLEYMPWKDSIITIPIAETSEVFSWTVKPTYYGQYVLRANLILIDILKNNQFRKDVYFMDGDTVEETNLREHYSREMSLYHLNVRNVPFPMKAAVERALATVPKLNKNSKIEMDYLETLKYQSFLAIDTFYRADNVKDAQYLVDVYNKYLPQKEFPIQMETAEWLKDIKNKK